MENVEHVLLEPDAVVGDRPLVHLLQVLVQDALAVEPDRRDAQALGIDFFGLRVVTRRNRSTNIGHMASAGAGISGVVVNEDTVQNMKITIQNGNGEIVKTIDAGTQGAGNIQFNWDGTDKDGNPMPAGDYVISATGELNGEGTQLPTAINRHVGSVSLAGSNKGIILNLAGDVSINLDDVIQIGN